MQGDLGGHLGGFWASCGEEEARAAAGQDSAWASTVESTGMCSWETSSKFKPSHSAVRVSHPPSASHSCSTLSPLSSSPSREWPLIFGGILTPRPILGQSG